MGESRLIAPTCIKALNTSLEGLEDTWGEGPHSVKKKVNETGPDAMEDLRGVEVTMEVNNTFSQVCLNMGVINYTNVTFKQKKYLSS